VPVKGTYDDAFRLSLEYTARYGGLNRNTAYHPLTIEGKKTVGLEIWQQNGWRVPDGDRGADRRRRDPRGVFKAFEDLRAAGLIERLPRLVCVQAEKSSSAIHRYIVTGTTATPPTRRRSRTPSRSRSRRTRTSPGPRCSGAAAARSRSATGDPRPPSARSPRPAACSRSPPPPRPWPRSASCATAGILEAGDQVVVLVTGHGLKDVDAALPRRDARRDRADPAGLDSVAGRLAEKGAPA
jgi:threonine synthase